MTRILSLLAMLILMASAFSPAHAQEVITLRSGNGAPGATDSNITFYSPGDGVIAPFSAADFDAARSGPAAVVVPADPVWLPTLTADPAAQWIGADASKSPRSALYAYSFQVTSSQISSAVMDLYFAVDNELGDPSNAGIYINGTAVTGITSPAWSDEQFHEQHHFASANIGALLHAGTNTLYLYQYDWGGVAGSLFSATITIRAPVTTQPTITPDMAVKKDSDPVSAYLGVGIAFPIPVPAETTGLTVPASGSARYQVMVTNQSSTASSFPLKAIEFGDPNWHVAYHLGTADITAPITGGGYVTDSLAPGAAIVLTVDVVENPGNTPGSTRYVLIDGFKDVTNSTVQDCVEMVTVQGGVPIFAPAAPSNLLATAGDGAISLTWTAPAADSTHGVPASYTIKRSTTSGAEVTLRSGVTDTKYTDSGLTDGTTYYYVVTASNDGGESASSNEASATPQPPPPPPSIQHTFTGTGWHLISSPYTLSKTFSALSMTTFAYNPAAQTYVMTPTAPADAFHIGTGYWVYVNGVSLNVSAPGTPADSTSPQSITLGQGWNLVGNPFLTAMTLSQVSVAQPSGGSVPFTTAVTNHAVSALFVFDNPTQRYQLLQNGSDSLNSWDGAWIYCKVAGTVLTAAPGVLSRFQAFTPGDVGVSSITAAELVYGAHKSQHVQRNQLAVEQFLLPLIVAPFDLDASLAYGRLRAELERAGTPIGSLDMLIAAHALSLNVAVATNNTREFSRVPVLKVENWSTH